jgi:hypothetical protein
MNKPTPFGKTYKEYTEAVEKFELSKTERVELGAIDDLESDYYKLLSTIEPHQKKAYQEGNEISKIAVKLLDVAQNAKILIGMAKELGADSVQKSAEKLEKNAMVKFKYYGKVADNIAKATK